MKTLHFCWLVALGNWSEPVKTPVINPTLTPKGDFSPGSLPSKSCCGHRPFLAAVPSLGVWDQHPLSALKLLWAAAAAPKSSGFPSWFYSVQDFAGRICHMRVWDRFVWRDCSVWGEKRFCFFFLFIIPLAFSKIQWNSKWADEILVFCPTVNPRIVLLP